MILIKICGLIFAGLCGSFIIKLLKPEYSYLIVISTAVLCIAIILTNGLADSISKIQNLSMETASIGYTKILLKALGIGYLTIITSEICKKAGEEMFSNVIETAGKFEILALCIPMASDLIAAAKDLL